MLERIRDDIERGVLIAPIDRSRLAGSGIRDNVDLLMAALAGRSRLAALGMLNLVLAERAARKKRPELVWTGPEVPRLREPDRRWMSVSPEGMRDAARSGQEVVMRHMSLVTGAAAAVLVGGYRVDVVTSGAGGANSDPITVGVGPFDAAASVGS